MRRATQWLVVLMALGLASCLADFDKTLWDFTEGPVKFHLDAAGMEVQPELMVDVDGECSIASVDCADEACAVPDATCSADNVCSPQTVTVLSQVVDMGDAYAPEQSRVASVSLQELSAVLVDSSLDFSMQDVRILWAPLEAPQSEAQEIAVLAPVEPGGSSRALSAEMVDEGVRALQSHLVHYEGFRLFVSFGARLHPGDSCPAGTMDLELSLRFLMTGEPRV